MDLGRLPQAKQRQGCAHSMDAHEATAHPTAQNGCKVIFGLLEFALKFHGEPSKIISHDFEVTSKWLESNCKNAVSKQLNDHMVKFAALHLHRHGHCRQSKSIFWERMQRPARLQPTVAGLVHFFASKMAIDLSLWWCPFTQVATLWLLLEPKECSNGATSSCSLAAIDLFSPQTDCAQLQIPSLQRCTLSSFAVVAELTVKSFLQLFLSHF